jgi:phage antirepressor YoqD-like protein
MGKVSKPNIEYADILINEWQEHGGLILQAEAARMLNVSETQINNMAKKKILYKKKIQGNAYIGYSDLYKVYRKRISKN